MDNVFAGILTLLFAQFPAVYVELSGLLECYILRDLPMLLAKDEPSGQVIRSLLERKTLHEFADCLVAINVWTQDDAAFAKELAKIRNAVAHQNAKLLSRYFGNGESLHPNDAKMLTYEMDCSNFIVRTIGVITKLAIPALRTGAGAIVARCRGSLGE